MEYILENQPRVLVRKMDKKAAVEKLNRLMRPVSVKSNTPNIPTGGSLLNHTNCDLVAQMRKVDTKTSELLEEMKGLKEIYGKQSDGNNATMIDSLYKEIDHLKETTRAKDTEVHNLRRQSQNHQVEQRRAAEEWTAKLDLLKNEHEKIMDILKQAHHNEVSELRGKCMKEIARLTNELEMSNSALHDTSLQLQQTKNAYDTQAQSLVQATRTSAETSRLLDQMRLKNAHDLQTMENAHKNSLRQIVLQKDSYAAHIKALNEKNEKYGKQLKEFEATMKMKLKCENCDESVKVHLVEEDENGNANENAVNVCHGCKQYGIFPVARYSCCSRTCHITYL